MIRLCAPVAGLGMLVAPVWATEKPLPESANLRRGKYLVENVALCGDCHTPFNEKGEPIESRKLQGAPVTFTATVPVPSWARKAPGVAGLDSWSEADVVSLLSTGQTTKGIRARPPMPKFRLTLADAEAVVSYLKSLPSSAEGKKGGH
jgi:mono/diheme cytochrome c family protein